MMYKRCSYYPQVTEELESIALCMLKNVEVSIMSDTFNRKLYNAVRIILDLYKDQVLPIYNIHTDDYEETYQITAVYIRIHENGEFLNVIDMVESINLLLGRSYTVLTRFEEDGIGLVMCNGCKRKFPMRLERVFECPFCNHDRQYFRRR